MTLEEIVRELARRLPLKTEAVTDSFGISGIVRSGTTLTVTTTAAHGFDAGDAVAIVGADTPILIDTFERSDETVGTITTAEDHDLTESTSKTVRVLDDGGADPAFVGEFTIADIPNRRTIVVEMAQGVDQVETNTALAFARSALQDVNGLYEVASAPSTFVFTVDEPNNPTMPSPEAGFGQTMQARISPRISAAVDGDRVRDAYTSQEVGKLWVFVTLFDATAAKSERTQYDVAVSDQQGGQFFRQVIVQGIAIHVLFPASEEIGARGVRDDAQDLFRPLCQSILGFSPESGLAAGRRGMVNFVRHGTEAYDGATYHHRYDFEVVYDLTFEDTIGADLDVAFRDIDMTIHPGRTDVELPRNPVFSLDEQPLP